MRYRHICRFPIACAVWLAGLAAMPARAQQWIAPTPEELHMTAVPELPGARAIVLNRNETADDDNHMTSHYFRIKILTEAGKDLGDVRLLYDKRSDGNGFTVAEIAGRTIQPDGTVVPFAGKPYDKVLEKNKRDQITTRVFSMPAVQVGSILEYRYNMRWDDRIFYSPDWNIQADLFLRQGHFLWKPTQKELLSASRGRQATTSSLAWNAVLPKGVELKRTHLPTGRVLMEVNVANVEPFGAEEYMPPVESDAYHVHFYYSPYKSGQEYWRTEGKYWSSDANKFAAADDMVRTAAKELAGNATGEEEKARALYRGVAKLENTDFTRQRSTTEEKTEGLKETKNAGDVLRKKRGSGDQIAMTYVALARAAGLNASMMIVADRSERLLKVDWMNFNQLTDVIAVVNYGGTEHFLDPGSPMMPYGHLHWSHTMSAGVRQRGNDTELAQAPAESYKYSHTSRVADLKLEENGAIKGVVSLTFEGCPAVRWRQASLRDEDAELRQSLKEQLESILPGGSEVAVQSVSGLQDAEAPLKVSFAVSGLMGSAAGSRVVLPADVFVANSRARFPHERRDQAVYYPYPEFVQDAVRLTFPPGFALESAPAENKLAYKELAAYGQRSKVSGNSVTVWRDLAIADFYFPLQDYPELRSFYAGFERKDHDSVVLKRSSTEKASVP